MYNITQPTKLRKIAIYARVSTEHEAQLSALENQKDWYKPILESNPEWELVEMYIDEGITGTSASKRTQFLRMIEDAKDAKFDLILTRDVPRFARNTVDTLQYTRQLKAIGVEVYFLNDNIRTFDGDGELRLTIMATLAQDESRKTSIRVKSGQKTSMEKGTFYGNGNILGYDRVGKDMVINKEQAETVKMIFDWYLEGWGVRKIQFKLEKLKRKTSSGKTNWHAATVSHILRNPFYCGIIIYRKQYVPDYLEQKKVNNYGEADQVKIKGSHDPIVSEGEFELAQHIMSSRRRTQINNPYSQHKSSGVRPPIDVWTKLMVCECGHKFNRKIWHRLSDGSVQYGYQCYGSIRTGSVKTRKNKGLSTEGVCATPMVPGWKLQMMAKYVFKNCLRNTNDILNLSIKMLEDHIDDKNDILNDHNVIDEKEAELQKLNKRLNNLIEMRADGELTKEIFLNKQSEILQTIKDLNIEIQQLKNQDETNEEDNMSHSEKIALLKYSLEQLVDFNKYEDSDLPDEVIEAFVKKIVVSEHGFEWYLRFDSNNTVGLRVKGKRKKEAEVSLLCDMQHRQQSLRNNSADDLSQNIFPDVFWGK